MFSHHLYSTAVCIVNIINGGSSFTGVNDDFINAGSSYTAVNDGYDDYTAVNDGYDDYMAIIDAGSSHTGVLLYGLSMTEPPQEVTQCLNEDGGIAQFAEYPQGVWQYLQPCLKQVAVRLPRGQLPLTPIFLGATAGMRLLQEEKPSSAREVMEVVRLLLSQAGFSFQPEDARILSGREEGGYSWVTVNSIQGILGDEDTNTEAALDMGGASAQVAFECRDEGAKVCDSDVLEFNIYGKDYRVFSRSNECYGLKEAMGRFVVLIILENYLRNGGTITNAIVNPCLGSDSSSGKDDWLKKFPFKKSEIFSSRCTHLVESDFANSINDLDEEFEFKHVEGWSEEACRGVIDKLINDECERVFDDASHETCFHQDDPIQSAKSDGFLAMSSYFWEFGRFLNISHSSSINQVNDKIEDLCNEGSEGEFIGETDCFEVTYIYKMLTDGYGFDQDTFDKLEFVEKVKGKDVAWPLGFVVIESFNNGVHLNPNLLKGVLLCWIALLIV